MSLHLGGPAGSLKLGGPSGPVSISPGGGIPLQSILGGWDVWVDAEEGLTNKGFNTGTTVTLEGLATDSGVSWNVPDATSGIKVVGTSIDQTFASPVTTRHEILLVCDLGTITGGSGDQIIAALFKEGVADTAKGIQISANGTTTYAPKAQSGDGATAEESTANSDIAGAGVVVLYAFTGTVGSDLLAMQTSIGGTFLQTLDFPLGNNDYTTTGSAIMFGCGTSAAGGTAAQGVNGTRTLSVLAGAARSTSASPVLTSGQLAAIADHYSAL